MHNDNDGLGGFHRSHYMSHRLYSDIHVLERKMQNDNDELGAVKYIIGC